MYHLYFDNYFTSPDLVVHLLKNGLRSTGTVRKDRVKNKHDFDKKALRGEYKVSHELNTGVNHISVIDSKPVAILSSATGVTPITSMQRYSKNEHKKVDRGFPHAFVLYNRFMGGVDLHDYRCNRIIPSIRSRKWTWVIFLRILQSSIVNATVLWNLCCQKGQEVSGKDVCMEVSKYYRSKKEKNNLSAHKHRTQSRAMCSFAGCSQRTTRTCIDCNAYFCLSCFEKYHGKK